MSYKGLAMLMHMKRGASIMLRKKKNSMKVTSSSSAKHKTKYFIYLGEALQRKEAFMLHIKTEQPDKAKSVILSIVRYFKRA